MLETAVVVKVNEGLHARPATQFAKLAKEFSCSLQITRGTTSADAKSAVKLMLLGIKQDDQILLRADGTDESLAVNRLLAEPGLATAGSAMARILIIDDDDAVRKATGIVLETSGESFGTPTPVGKLLPSSDSRSEIP